MDLILPFKIGDLAEARSLVPGFNGAWFRSKIEDTRVTESGHLEYYLEYIDYTEEAKEWLRVFRMELNPECGNGKSSTSCQIMLRPSFAQWCREGQVPEHFSKSELIVTVCDTWKVGDWVEWLYEDCYWTAKIIKVLTKDVVQVSLLEPPMGEGGSYSAKLNDLRPALDWSIIEGWTVPRSHANGKCWYAACLIHPKPDIEESDADEEDALRSPIKTRSLDANSASKLSNQRDTIMTSKKKLRPTTHKSSDPSQQSTRSSRKRWISLSERVQLQPPDTTKATMAEPNRPSNRTDVRQHSLRVRKSVMGASVRHK
ncbi:hypothetical protein ACQ4PT_014721 [Festuca glaucescens]